jgi:alkyl hydroperoxide reductase subunit AhpC
VSAVADEYAELQKLGCEVISVSVDSHFVHKMWNDHQLTKMVEGGVPFPMALDQAGNVGRAYGVWDESQGIELRGRFIIDPDGVIQAAEVLTPPVGRRFAETVRQVQAFQHVRNTKGGGGDTRGVDARPADPGGQRLEGLAAEHGAMTGTQRSRACGAGRCGRRPKDA